MTGEALFSSLRPRVRAQNFSFFYNSELTAPNAASHVSNQVRFSYGRTRLRFDQVTNRLRFGDARDAVTLLPTAFSGTPFLLDAPVIMNITQPATNGIPNTGPINYNYNRNAQRDITPAAAFGPLGQVIISGFSPLGVDVYNFPQRRVNNTYQLADQLTWRFNNHNLAFGTDNRRSELNSDLPRVARPIAVFQGAPRLAFVSNQFVPLAAGARVPFVRPEDLAATSAASSFFLTLNNNGRRDANINLRYYQLNFFAQDEWRLHPRLSLSYGLRYEYNTPPREINGLIEQTFTDPALNLVGARGLAQFIDGRTRIFESDRNNLAPRLSLAYSPNWFGRERVTVMRAGYGLFYDQTLGAVVSQSRNVFPSFLTLNFGGLKNQFQENVLDYKNPVVEAIIGNNAVTAPGTINQLNPATPLNQTLLTTLQNFFPSALSLTLPRRQLPTPMAHHFTAAVEQQLGRTLTVSAAYVGTLGRNLLRFTTPNLGPGTVIVPTRFDSLGRIDPLTLMRINLPQLSGRILTPGAALGAPISQLSSRPVPDAGAVNLFETTGKSHYNSLQLQLRGRFRQSWEYQASYTFSSARDDVSDVFDLAGAPALPQNSLTFVGERGPANFDVRHRLTYYFVYNFSDLSAARWRWLLNGLQLASLGSAQTGQPFTVNSIFDVNLDGNLTDRLDTTQGLIVTGERRQPLRLVTSESTTLLAAPGQDGRLGRNTFRAGSVLDLDLAVIKNFSLRGGQKLNLRVDIFNFINRANFGIPVRWLEAPGFGQATQTVIPGRRIQVSLKYSF